MHDLVTDLHEKQKGFDVHALTMKQVKLQEQTLKKQHDAAIKALEDRLD